MNTMVDGYCDVSSGSTIVSLGHNIATESPYEVNTCVLGHPTDLFDVPATALNLGPLADNGGPTMTHALLAEPIPSVAIDAIPEMKRVLGTEYVFYYALLEQPQYTGYEIIRAELDNNGKVIPAPGSDLYNFLKS